MLKNYFKIALRNLLRNSVYSIINVSGLAIGIACTILIMLWVYDEVTYDRFQPKYKNLYQAWIRSHYDGTINSWTSGPQPLAEGIKNTDPHVKNTVLADWGGEHLLRVGDNRITKQGHYVGPTFLEMFQFELLKGDAASILDDPTSIVLSESTARALFGDQDPINQVVNVDDFGDLKVTGILKDIPRNSSFEFDCLMTWEYYKKFAGWIKETENTWGEYSFQTFVELEPGTSSAEVDNNIREILTKNGQDEMKREVFLYPMNRWRLHSSFKNGVEDGGLIDYVMGFTAIAAFIMVIACINFMNLSTARSGTRAKEVGVRKVMGSLRSHLVKQFLMEAVILSAMSFAIGVVITWITIPLFNSLAVKELSLPFDSAPFWILLAGASMIIGLLAGLYPAFFLSSFRPAAILKGSSAASGKSFLRNGMVVFQFTISILLIVGTITVNRQLSFIQNKRIGFDRSQIIIVKDGYALRPNPQVFKTEALKISSIQRGTMTGHIPIDSHDFYRNTNATWREGQEPSPENMVNLQTWAIDEDYIPTYGMNIIEGRNFSKAFPSDENNIIINQEAAKIFNFEGGPIGKRISSFMGDDATKDNVKTFTIVGVVEDFHFASMKVNIGPLAFVNANSDGAFSFKFEASKTKETIEALEAAWKKIGPSQPFNYTFLDEEFGKMYVAEQRLGKIFEVFSGLAIIIACIGLFALTAFTAEQRTKEIGIRKVLGASVPGIVVLLSKEFGKLILIAFLIAAPIAWFGVDWWLTGYSYKTNIGVWVYALAGGLIAVIAIATMSFQSIKAALANPVKSLRSE